MLNKLLFRAVEEEEQGPEKKEKNDKRWLRFWAHLRRSDSDVPLSSDVVSEPPFCQQARIERHPQEANACCQCQEHVGPFLDEVQQAMKTRSTPVQDLWHAHCSHATGYRDRQLDVVMVALLTEDPSHGDTCDFTAVWIMSAMAGRQQFRIVGTTAKDEGGHLRLCGATTSASRSCSGYHLVSKIWSGVFPT